MDSARTALAAENRTKWRESVAESFMVYQQPYKVWAWLG